MTENQKAVKYPKPADFKPEPFFPEDHPHFPSKARCGAWARSRNQQCGNVAPTNGTSKCKMHGGATPRSVDSPHWKHGRNERRPELAPTPHNEAVAKTRWKDAYERYMGDIENLSLADDIAFNRAQIADAIEAVASSIIPEFLDELETTVTSARDAASANNGRALASAIIQIDQMIAQARKDMLGERRLDRLTNQRMVMIDKQTKLIERNERHLPIQVVVSLMLRVFGNLSDIVERSVDPAISRSIFAEMSLIVRDSMIYLGTVEDQIIEGKADAG